MSTVTQVFDPVSWRRKRDLAREQARQRADQLTRAAKAIADETRLAPGEIPSSDQAPSETADALLALQESLLRKFGETQLRIRAAEEAEVAENKRLDEEERARQRKLREEEARKEAAERAARNRKIVAAVIVAIVLLIIIMVVSHSSR